jgi:competence protein ComGC
MGEDIKLLVVLVIMSLLFLYLVYYLPKEWKKAQKELKEHEVME